MLGVPEPLKYGATHDLVVVVPGIMGTALRDRASGSLVWGLSDARWYLEAWSPGGHGLTPLALTETELEALDNDAYDLGRSRIEPAGLLRGPVPAFAPILRALEPYTALVKRLRDAVVDPAAVLEFDYDWRLPTAFNSRLLANAVARHLEWWRKQPLHAVGRRFHPEERDAQVIIVAHSMGGLVAQGLGLISGALDDVRQVITLGTPFYGAVKTLSLLEDGEGAPLPFRRGRLRDAVRTMPGVYDLLPRLRSLLVPGNPIGEDVVAVTPAHVAAIGANEELAKAAADRFLARRDVHLPGLKTHVGTHQPTAQSARLEHGRVLAESHYYKFGADDVIRDSVGQPVQFDEGQGDGTVPWRSARPLGHRCVSHLPQQHGALASSSEALKAIVADVKDDDGLGDRLGKGDVGIDLPDVALAGEPIKIWVTGETDPARATCRVTDLRAPIGTSGRGPWLERRGERLVAEITLGEGLYRVAVKSGGGEAVSQVVLVTESS